MEQQLGGNLSLIASGVVAKWEYHTKKLFRVGYDFFFNWLLDNPFWKNSL